MTAPVVVKLGGSLARAPALKAWLSVIAAAQVPVIMVAGGGPFADAVRDAQPAIGFDDRAAHRMAILGMAQYAEALASLDDRLVLAAGDAAIAAAVNRQRPVIWNPLPLALDPAIPHSWNVTSDSLAAWLCRRFAAPHLILVKQVERQPPPLTPDALAARGIVDRAFPEMARGVSALWLADREAQPALGAVMKGRAPAETTLARIG